MYKLFNGVNNNNSKKDKTEIVRIRTYKQIYRQTQQQEGEKKRRKWHSNIRNDYV